ncbi:TIGR02444 family protein [Alkalicaulis satelles]|uniref:TIGR02444 family protein n=1 Tax=Alkalicaulis satelles TaxID=2609175 RepID=A0A5M6ZCB9_9PROT|nr:TIGR02444 family protein [Alkalicaulis satelles]KAA5802396.1 TIGR02444 family protein [Alkalicaulis satelles]
MNTPPERFWDFSLAVYPRPGVKDACLDLQGAGLDVNLALWIAWHGAHGRDAAPALDAAIALSRDWSAGVVKPLRAARDVLKTPPDYVRPEEARALRQAILATELEAERLQQMALEPLQGARPSGLAPRALTEDGLAACAARMRLDIAPHLFVESVFGALESV